MSFMFRKPQEKLPLGNNNRGGANVYGAAPMTAPLTSLRVSAFRRNATATTTGGAGQTQLMRHREETKVNQRQSHTTQPPAQKAAKTVEGNQGVISMAEVLKDLQILEAQQRESHQQLEIARQTKERRVSTQTNLEAALEELKYRNGQERVRLQTWRDKLSQGNRTISRADRGADSARCDFERVEVQLQHALETKRALAANLRRHKTLLAGLQRKYKFVRCLEDNATELAAKAASKRLNIKTQERTLHDEIRQGSEREKSFFEDTMALRLDSSLVEQEISAIKMNQIEKRRQVERMQKIIFEEQQRHQISKEATEREEAGARQEKNKMIEEIRRTVLEVSTKKEELHTTWKTLIEMQMTEGHTPCLPPSETMDLPAFNFEKLAESVKAVVKAINAEVVARADIKAEVGGMHTDAKQRQLEIDEAKKHFVDLRDSNKSAELAEKERKASLIALFGQLEEARKEHEGMSATISALQKKRDGIICALKVKADNAHNAMKRIVELVTDARKDVAGMECIIERKETDYNKRQQDHASTIDEMEEGLVVSCQLLQELKNRSTCVKSNLEALEGSSDLSHDKSLEQMQRDIANLLQEFPALQTIKLEIDGKKSKKEQAKGSLAALHKACKKRIECAKKSAEQSRQEKKKRDRKTLEIKTEEAVHLPISAVAVIASKVEESKVLAPHQNDGSTAKMDTAKAKMDTAKAKMDTHKVGGSGIIAETQPHVPGGVTSPNEQDLVCEEHQSEEKFKNLETQDENGEPAQAAPEAPQKQEMNLKEHEEERFPGKEEEYLNQTEILDLNEANICCGIVKYFVEKEQNLAFENTTIDEVIPTTRHNEEFSATKPRDLLEQFTQASVESVGKVALQDDIDTHPTIIQDKRVRWGDLSTIAGNGTETDPSKSKENQDNTRFVQRDGVDTGKLGIGIGRVDCMSINSNEDSDSSIGVENKSPTICLRGVQSKPISPEPSKKQPSKCAVQSESKGAQDALRTEHSTVFEMGSNRQQKKFGGVPSALKNTSSSQSSEGNHMPLHSTKKVEQLAHGLSISEAKYIMRNNKNNGSKETPFVERPLQNKNRHEHRKKKVSHFDYVMTTISVPTKTSSIKDKKRTEGKNGGKSFLQNADSKLAFENLQQFKSTHLLPERAGRENGIIQASSSIPNDQEKKRQKDLRHISDKRSKSYRSTSSTEKKESRTKNISSQTKFETLKVPSSNRSTISTGYEIISKENTEFVQHQHTDQLQATKIQKESKSSKTMASSHLTSEPGKPKVKPKEHTSKTTHKPLCNDKYTLKQTQRKSEQCCDALEESSRQIRKECKKLQSKSMLSSSGNGSEVLKTSKSLFLGKDSKASKPTQNVASDDRQVSESKPKLSFDKGLRTHMSKSKNMVQKKDDTITSRKRHGVTFSPNTQKAKVSKSSTGQEQTSTKRVREEESKLEVSSRGTSLEQPQKLRRRRGGGASTRGKYESNFGLDDDLFKFAT